MQLKMQPNGKYLRQLVDDGKGLGAAATTATHTPPILPSPALGVGNAAVGPSGGANAVAPIPINPTPPAHPITPTAPIGATPATHAPIGSPTTPAYLRVYQQDPATKKYLIIKKATARMTPEELRRAQMSGLNKSVASTFAPAPSTPDPIRHPIAGTSDGAGFYFNPGSETLWSYRNADGTETLNATLPTNTDSAHYLDGHNSGLPGGALQRDAAWYTTHNSSAKELSDRLAGPRSNLAGFDKLYDGQTLAQRGLAQNTHDFNRNTDAAMSNLAQRGWLESGARGLTSADLVKQLSESNLATQSSVGSIARDNALTQIGQSRDAYTTNLMQSLSSFLMDKINGETRQAAAS